jgi:hypothetical protein
LENFHAATLIKLLGEPHGEDGDKAPLLAKFSADQLHKARALMIMLILATDTQKHLEDLAAFRLSLGSSTFDPLKEQSDQHKSLCMLFRAADIGHSAKNWEIHQVWSRRVVAEFHDQGDEEKRLGLKVSPLCEREGISLAKGQVGFLNFICLPTWKELARFEEHLHKPEIGQEGVRAHPKVRASARLPHLSGSTGRRSVESGRNTAVPVARTSSKVAPIVLGQTLVVQELGNASQKWIAEVCLAQCERNCQAWKGQVEADAAVSEAPQARSGQETGQEARLRESTPQMSPPGQVEPSASVAD